MSQHQRVRAHLSSLNAYERHKFLLHDYLMYYGKPGEAEAIQQHQPLPKTDAEMLREAYQFLPDASQQDDPSDYRQQLARRYHARLFREYAICNLSAYKLGKVGLRWRTQQEVLDGKGQFVCGAKTCDERQGLASFEVPFSYVEGGQSKQALVKVRVCPKHAYKLNYRKLKELEKQARKDAKRKRKKAKSSSKKGSSSRKRRSRSRSRSRRRHSDSGSSGASDDGGDSSRQKEQKRARAHGKEGAVEGVSDSGSSSGSGDEKRAGNTKGSGKLSARGVQGHATGAFEGAGEGFEGAACVSTGAEADAEGEDGAPAGGSQGPAWGPSNGTNQQQPSGSAAQERTAGAFLDELFDELLL